MNDVATMPDILHASLAQPRFRTFLLALFAAIALRLAATGIFGVISYSVSCRTQEIGIRLAVGASRTAILWMVSRETLVLTGAGVAVGIPCALAASRPVGHVLFGISAEDPATLVVVAFAAALYASRAMPYTVWLTNWRRTLQFRTASVQEVRCPSMARS